VAVPIVSWPGLSGPSVAAQMLEWMVRISRAMTIKGKAILHPSPYPDSHGAWPGHPRPVVLKRSKLWMTGTRPAMTRWERPCHQPAIGTYRNASHELGTRATSVRKGWSGTGFRGLKPFFSSWPGAVPAIRPRRRAASAVPTVNRLSVETINPGGITPPFTFAANTTGGGITLSVIEPAANQTWVWHARFDTVEITV
jgi:hypothetical protein